MKKTLCLLVLLTFSSSLFSETFKFLNVQKNYNPSVEAIYQIDVDNCQLDENSLEGHWLDTSNNKESNFFFLIEAPLASPRLTDWTDDRKSVTFTLQAFHEYPVPFKVITVLLNEKCRPQAFIKLNGQNHLLRSVGLRGHFDFKAIRFKGILELSLGEGLHPETKIIPIY